MADEKPNSPGAAAHEQHFIVLINKAPRGPLATSEVKVLLEQRVLSYNDVALRVDAETGEDRGSWKFLWQFVEFDRRLNRDGTPRPAREERRKAPEEVTPAHTLLPEELNDITPDELLVRSRPYASTPLSITPEEIEKESSLPLPRLNYGSSFSSPMPWMGGMALLLIIGMSFLYPNMKSKKTAPNREPDTTTMRPETQNYSSGPLTNTGVPQAQPRAAVIPKQTPLSMPPANAPDDMDRNARDDGEVPRSKVREEDLEDDGWGDEDPTQSSAFKKKRAKSKAKRQTAAEEDAADEAPPADESADDEPAD